MLCSLFLPRAHESVSGRNTATRVYYYSMFVFYVLSFHLSVIMFALGQLSVVVLAVLLTGLLAFACYYRL